MSRAIWKRGRTLSPEIVEALEASGKPWEIAIGTKHRKIMLDGRLVGVLPLKGNMGSNPGDSRNVIAAIRRASRHTPSTVGGSHG